MVITVEMAVRTPTIISSFDDLDNPPLGAVAGGGALPAGAAGAEGVDE